jgi:hypothetical protein
MNTTSALVVLPLLSGAIPAVTATDEYRFVAK